MGVGGCWSCWVLVMRCTCIVVNSLRNEHRVSLDLLHLFFTPQVDTCIDRLHTDFSAHNNLLADEYASNCVSVFIRRLYIFGLLGIIG